MVKLRGIGRVRARLLRNNGVKIPSDIKKVDLKRILGPNIARQILKNIDGPAEIRTQVSGSRSLDSAN